MSFLLEPAPWIAPWAAAWQEEHAAVMTEDRGYALMLTVFPIAAGAEERDGSAAAKDARDRGAAPWNG